MNWKYIHYHINLIKGSNFNLIVITWYYETHTHTNKTPRNKTKKQTKIWVGLVFGTDTVYTCRLNERLHFETCRKYQTKSSLFSYAAFFFYLRVKYSKVVLFKNKNTFVFFVQFLVHITLKLFIESYKTNCH